MQITMQPNPEVTYIQEPAELCTFSSGVVVFSDVNPSSGLNQTSLLFQQATAVGMSHSSVLRHILSRALTRKGIPTLPAAAPIALPGGEVMRTESAVAATQELGNSELERIDDEEASSSGILDDEPEPEEEDAYLEEGQEEDEGFEEAVSLGADDEKEGFGLRDLVDEPEESEKIPSASPVGFTPQKVFVLCGGNSSERQVSLSSGVSVYLQLSRCAHTAPAIMF